MPAGSDFKKRRTKTYGGIAPVDSNTAQTSVYVAPGNPDRSMLLVQNTGANIGLLRFGGAVLGDGSDTSFDPGAGLLFDRATTCPEASIYIGSVLGTTFSFTEQVTK